MIEIMGIDYYHQEDSDFALTVGSLHKDKEKNN
jgi:hypothetical protein